MTAQLARGDREDEVTHRYHESSRGSHILKDTPQGLNCIILGPQSWSHHDPRGYDRER